MAQCEITFAEPAPTCVEACRAKLGLARCVAPNWLVWTVASQPWSPVNNHSPASSSPAVNGLFLNCCCAVLGLPQGNRGCIEEMLIKLYAAELKGQSSGEEYTFTQM